MNTTELATIISQGHLDGKSAMEIAEEIEEAEKKNWLRVGGRYFYLYSDEGAGSEELGRNPERDEFRKKTLGVYRTEAEAIEVRDKILSGKIKVVMTEVE